MILKEFFLYDPTYTISSLIKFGDGHGEPQYSVKLEINNRRTTIQSPNAKKLSNSLLNNPWIKEEIPNENFKKICRTEWKGTPTYQNLWKVDKAVLRVKLIEWNAYNRKEVISQINNLSYYLKLENKKSKINSKQTYGRK